MAEIRNLAELKQAMDRGEVEDPIVVLDNDSSSLMVNGEDLDAWDIHPEELLEQALDLLGIKHESV